MTWALLILAEYISIKLKGPVMVGTQFCLGVSRIRYTENTLWAEDAHAVHSFATRFLT